MKKILFVIMLFPLSIISATTIEVDKKKQLFYGKNLPGVVLVSKVKIDDPISDNPINTIILKAYDKKKKHLGYIRHLNTTTGCNSSCLPLLFTLFYDVNKNFLKVSSEDGLTKLNHAPFSTEDLAQLNLLLSINPQSFKTVQHPLELTDGITRATKKAFVSDVVKEAAYSTLRINLYNQHTLKFLKQLK